MEKVTLCLVSFSVSRDYNKELTDEQLKIKKRLHELFCEMNGPVDGVGGNFDLNQVYYETYTYLRTSLGTMDFVDLPLEDSLWITKMYKMNKLDMRVYYKENEQSEKMYQEHTAFPDCENIVTKEVELYDRDEKYNEGLNKLKN